MKHAKKWAALMTRNRAKVTPEQLRARRAISKLQASISPYRLEPFDASTVNDRLDAWAAGALLKPGDTFTVKGAQWVVTFAADGNNWQQTVTAAPSQV